MLLKKQCWKIRYIKKNCCSKTKTMSYSHESTQSNNFPMLHGLPTGSLKCLTHHLGLHHLFRDMKACFWKMFPHIFQYNYLPCKCTFKGMTLVHTLTLRKSTGRKWFVGLLRRFTTENKGGISPWLRNAALASDTCG